MTNSSSLVIEATVLYDNDYDIHKYNNGVKRHCQEIVNDLSLLDGNR
jgi:hypothetical protein